MSRRPEGQAEAAVTAATSQKQKETAQWVR